jgi:chemotaxis protein methyltransferase CheR
LPPVPEALETSAAITPEKNAGFAEAARAAADRGDHERALTLSEHAIATDKLNAANHFLRACILIELGRLADAEAALRSVLFLDPAFVIAHFALGTLARQQGQAEVSRRHFSRAEQLLEEYHGGETLPGSDGLTAARLQAILEEAEFSRR